MRYDGAVFDYLEQTGTIKEATVTSERIIVHYAQDGTEWHIGATRTEGLVYRGDLGSGHSPECTVELAVYKSESGSILLFGRWASRRTGDTERFLLRLFPITEPVATAPETVKKPKKKKG
jgi:hypothetical protein